MFHFPIIILTVSAVTVSRVVAGSWELNSSKISVNVSTASSAPPLEVIQVSPVAGYIQTPEWGVLSSHPNNMDSVVQVRVPEYHAAMVTILHLNVSRKRQQDDGKNLPGVRRVCKMSKTWLAVNETRITTMSSFVWNCTSTRPLLRRRLAIGSDFTVYFKTRKSARITGFRLYFSAADESALLQQDRSGEDLWNCSVPNFADFKFHFPCDLTPQCLYKEDERDCPYFGEECGLGFVTLGAYCLVYSRSSELVTWRENEFVCQQRGLRMASFRSREDYDRLLEYLEPMAAYWGFFKIAVGIHTTWSSLPFMYHGELQHADETIAFLRFTRNVGFFEHVCGYMALRRGREDYEHHIKLSYCSKPEQEFDVLCEFPKRSSGERFPPVSVTLQPVSDLNSSRLLLVGCQRKHVTRDFLACDVTNTCWSPEVKPCPAPLTPLPPSFTCANGFQSVPYTLVCDVRPDCADYSDENFCEFPRCDLPKPFYCSERECVSQTTVCDGQKNCYNSADEHLCTAKKGREISRFPPPAIVQLEGNGQFATRRMNQPQMPNVSRHVCPETHFQCPNDGYCMPVFLRCNGVYDCIGKEDEAYCDSYSCPGFYRCRGSQVCLHPQHLCDDIFQCPQNDDELLCDLSCPHNCTCYGLAFYCRQTFQARNFNRLRFLDCRGSGLALSDFTENVMLIYLSVAANGLVTIGNLLLPNLRSLDLSDNRLKEFTLHDSSHVPRLTTLILSGNPLESFFQPFSNSTVASRVMQGNSTDDVHAKFSCSSERNVVIPCLHTLDLSRVKVTALNSSFLSLLPNLHTVNMSGCGVDTLLGEGFQVLTQLRALDLRGCPLTYFPRHIFRGLQELQTVRSDNKKLCCAATLPVGFVLKNCHAPDDEISSCEDLLKSNSYRVFLSVFAFLAMLGNISSFVYRVFLQKRKRSLSFDIFVAHLCVADFLMGVYLGVIGVADRLYQGTYLWEDNVWKISAVCHMAGFLSLVSSEVSALIICLITVDRFLVIRFPFSTFHFGPYSSQVASLCVWVTGCLIASIPLTHWAASWQFYSQSGICIPLPISRADSPGYAYAFGVMIVANLILFTVIAAGQFFIYCSVQTNSLSSTETTRRTKDLTLARRLITVAMSDFLCWFPIGLAGFLAATGTPISGEVNVAMAIFVLPFNSALNPFLYTLNVILEKRRKAAEERIKKQLRAQFRSVVNEDKTMSSKDSCVS